VPTTPATVICGSSGYPVDICGVLGGAHSTALEESHDVVPHKLEFAGEYRLHSPILIVGEGLTDPKFAPRNVSKYAPSQDGKLYGRLFTVNVGASKLKTTVDVW
jgi:hypothetical protein